MILILATLSAALPSRARGVELQHDGVGAMVLPQWCCHEGEPFWVELSFSASTTRGGRTKRLAEMIRECRIHVVHRAPFRRDVDERIPREGWTIRDLEMLAERHLAAMAFVDDSSVAAIPGGGPLLGSARAIVGRDHVLPAGDYDVVVIVPDPTPDPSGRNPGGGICKAIPVTIDAVETENDRRSALSQAWTVAWFARDWPAALAAARRFDDVHCWYRSAEHLAWSLEMAEHWAEAAARYERLVGWIERGDPGLPGCFDREQHLWNKRRAVARCREKAVRWRGVGPERPP